MSAVAPSHAAAATPAIRRSEGAREHGLREVEASVGDALVDIARLSNAAITVADGQREVAQILEIRQRAVEGLEDLQAARDARARDRLRMRRLMPGLRELTQRFQAQTRILTELRTPTREPALPEDVAWALYSVAEEALYGLERRSRATGIVIIVGGGSEEISLSIRDDGVGLLARQGAGWRASPHAAVRAMSRTMEAVGGEVSISSARPRGLLVRAVIPLRVA